MQSEMIALYTSKATSRLKFAGPALMDTTRCPPASVLGESTALQEARTQAVKKATREDVKGIRLRFRFDMEGSFE